MNKFKLVTDIIYDNNIKKDINITHISDIHFNKNIRKEMLDDLKKYIVQMNSCYLMITGDIIDNPVITKNSRKIEELLVFFREIAKEVKVIISLGNHDIKNKEDYEFFDELDKIDNIYVLNNKEYIDEFIYVFGFTLPYEYYHNNTLDESAVLLLDYLSNYDEFIGKNNDKYKIALIHSPIKLVEVSVLDKLKNFDLVLSGHMHNGMVPDILSFLFKKNMGIIAPNKKLFPKIARGKVERYIKNKKITIIINGAITKLSLRSGGILSKLNFLYNKSVNKIIIRRRDNVKD